MSAQGKPLRCEIIHDNFQNYKKYNVPKAQLVIADIPYNIGTDAYGSNPMWYKGGDNANGESKLAKKAFFNSDGYFKIAEYKCLGNAVVPQQAYPIFRALKEELDRWT